MDNHPDAGADRIPSDTLMLRRDAAAKQLGISDYRIQKLIDAGQLAATKVGVSWYVSATELERYLQTTKGGADAAQEPQLLSVPSVAKRLDCSRAHVYRLIAAGALRTVQIKATGTRAKTRVRVEDLQEFVETRTVEASA
jgi:excisionase family DNA binding protein